MCEVSPALPSTPHPHLHRRHASAPFHYTGIMNHSCPRCATVFAKSDTLKMHLERFPGHSKLNISEVCKEHRVPRSPIADALCDAALV